MRPFFRPGRRLSSLGLWARHRSRALGLGLAAGLVGVAAHGAEAHPRSPACEAPEAYVLGNGVEVRLRVDHALPAIAVLSSVHAGGRNDPRGHEGLAHYVEHLTFRSSAPFASVDQLDGLAGAFNRNGLTSLDTTDYFSVVPPEQLELALWIEARRLAIGLDTVDPGQALDERKVILREHVLRFGRGAELARKDALNQAIFAEGHPYRRPYHSVESQEHLTLDEARWFFGRYYRPERVRVVIVGDFRPDEAKALVARLFGTLPARGAVSAPSSEQGGAGPVEDCRVPERSKPLAPSRVVVTTPGHRELLHFVWPVPFGEDGVASLAPLFAIGSEIGLTLREKGLADRVTLDLDPRELGQLWSFEIEPIPGRSFEQVATLVRSELARRANQVPDAQAQIAYRQAAELEDARTGRALLDRALTLARRECRPSACVNPARALDQDWSARARHFDPRRAVIIESRYGQFARQQGDVETMPVENAP